MGSDRGIRTGLVLRCCQGAFFGFGLIVTVLTLAVMFWIAWCYFGLTIIQLSDTQRRAIVGYSYSLTKPSPSPTSSPVRSTTVAPEETSINSISKSATTATVLRGASRGESSKLDKRKETLPGTSTLAKGDFASRDRPTHGIPAVESKDSSVPRGPPNAKDDTLSDTVRKADILSGSSSEESDEDRIYVRRVSSPGAVNRPDKKLETDDGSIRRSPTDTEPRSDISPSKVYNEAKSGSSRKPQDPEVDRSLSEDDKTQPRDYIDRDKSVPSRRDDSPKSDSESVYREPEFDREYRRRYAPDTDRDNGRSRYDDIDDERRLRSRYDKRDRGRDSDDRYSKGDTRVYPEDRPPSDDRYRDRVRERYPEDSRRRGDDDRYDDHYRDYEERPKYHERELDRRDRDRVERFPAKDEKYRDGDRPRSEEKYRPRDDDAYGYRDDERYRYRNDERYRSYGDDRNRSRNEDRFRDREDDRYRTRDGDKYRDDEKYRRDPTDRRDSTSRYRDEDRSSFRTDEERYINVSKTRDENYRRPVSRNREDFLDDDRRYSDERDRYRTRPNDDRYADIAPSRSRDVDIRDSASRSTSYLPPRDRKLSSSRAGYDERNIETVSDYDLETRDRTRSYRRDGIEPIRKSKPYYEERIISGYDEDEKRISPTRTRVEDSISRSSLVESRPREPGDNTRYTKDRRNEDDRYDQDDRIRNTRIQGSRGSTPPRDSSRRLSHNRDDYRTRLPSERTENDKVIERREEVVLDRRSYTSEEEDEYKKKEERRDYEYDERNRRPTDDTRRRFIDDDRYSERDRMDDEKYRRGRPRTNYDGGSTRSRDRYVDETRRYDDRYASRDDDRFISRDDRSPLLPVRKSDTYPDDAERARRSDSNTRKEDSMDRDEKPRSSIPPKSGDRYYSRDEYSESKSPSRRRYDDDLSLPDYKDDFSEERRRSGTSKQQANAKDPNDRSSVTPVRSSEPSDVVIREKRFHSTEIRPQNSRVSANDDNSKDRRYLDSGSESRSREEVRPLSAKDVIAAAIRHSDSSNKNARKVYYPVFDPRISNLTSSEVIRPSERRGTTITAKRRRST